MSLARWRSGRGGLVPGRDLLDLGEDACPPSGRNDRKGIVVDGLRPLVGYSGRVDPFGRHAGDDQRRADHADPYRGLSQGHGRVLSGCRDGVFRWSVGPSGGKDGEAPATR